MSYEVYNKLTKERCYLYPRPFKTMSGAYIALLEDSLDLPEHRIWIKNNLRVRKTK